MAKNTQAAAAATDETTAADREVELQEPTGAAADEEKAAKDQAAAAAAAAEIVEGDEKDPVSVGEGDKIAASAYAGGKDSEFVTIKQDVVEDFVYPGSKRVAQRVLFARGQVVRRSQIEAYNAAAASSDA